MLYRTVKTSEELLNLIWENDNALYFNDGYAMTDWRLGKFVLFTPDQTIDQGTVCDFNTAIKFFNEHNK